LIVKDNFFPDVEALRSDVISKGFRTIHNPADGLDYPGIQLRESAEFQESIAALVGFPIKVNTAVMRITYKGELADNSVHSDNNMGEFAGVGYLTPKNAPVTGTAFWTDKETGWEELPETARADVGIVARLRSQANDQSKWINSGFIAARPGRFITYPTKRFHSRYPFASFGETPETGRIILAIFYDRA
jgi:hypothetical protein